jgi:uncharacterized protein
MTAIDRRESLAREAIAAINAFEPARLEALFADDVAMEFPFAPAGMPQRIEGRDAVLKAMAIAPKIFERLDLSVLDLHPSAASDTLVIEAESNGRWRRGDDYRNRYVFLIRFRDDQIVLWREYLDPRPLAPPST